VIEEIEGVVEERVAVKKRIEERSWSVM